MKLTAQIIGILLFLAGAVWFLQGINILPGSFMSGSAQWAVNGGISMLVGAAAFWWGQRRQAK